MGWSPEQMMDRLGQVHEQVQMFREQQAIEQARYMERLRGRKKMRFSLFKTGANPFTMGGDAAVASGGIIVGPDTSNVWSVRLLVIEGLTSGATPDVVNIRIGSASGPLIWQLNGNSFGVTFGRGEMFLWPGEFLFFQSVGTFAATGTITARGLADQVPAEMMGELF